MTHAAKQALIDDLRSRRQKCLDMRAENRPGTAGAAFGRIIERYESMLRKHGVEIEGKQ